jgi:hypothetical protein
MGEDTSYWTRIFLFSSSAHGPASAVITRFVLPIKPGVFSPLGGIGARWKTTILTFTEMAAFFFLHKHPSFCMNQNLLIA